MAKNTGRNNGQDTDVDDDDDTPVQPKMNASDLKKVFAQWGTINKKAEAIEKDLEKLRAEANVFVKQIAEGYGKGPFNFEGKMMMIRKRVSKDDEGKPIGEPTYYFVQQSQQDVVNVG